jgi:hypothetical protein
MSVGAFAITAQQSVQNGQFWAVPTGDSLNAMKLGEAAALPPPLFVV